MTVVAEKKKTGGGGEGPGWHWVYLEDCFNLPAKEPVWNTAFEGDQTWQAPYYRLFGKYEDEVKEEQKKARPPHLARACVVARHAAESEQLLRVVTEHHREVGCDPDKYLGKVF